MNKIKLQIVILLLFVFGVTKSTANAHDFNWFSDMDQLAAIEQIFVQYDQTEIVEHDAYKNAFQNDRLKMLEKHFYKKQAEAHDRVRKIFLLTKCSIDLSRFGTIGFAVIGYKLKKKFGLKKLGTMGTIIGAQALSQAIGEPISGLLTDISKCVTQVAKPYISNFLFRGMGLSSGIDIDDVIAIQKKLNDQNLAYIRIKPQLNKKLCKDIEKYLVQLIYYESVKISAKKHGKKANSETDESNQGKAKEAQENIEEILGVVLNLPQKTKILSYDEGRINSAFFGYKTDAIRSLQRYCIRQVAASTSGSVRKVVAYFQGPPGTGKTRAAGCVARALDDLPFEVISLSKISQDELVGTGKKPGILLDFMTRASRYGDKGYKNMVLLLDDADRVLNKESVASSFILNLLEPETKEFYSPFLDMYVDISHLCIIMAGNSEIEDPALRSRLQVIRFEPYSADYKKIVAWTTMIPELLKIHERSALPLSITDLDDDKEIINDIIERDEDPGFRSIKLKLMEYLEEKVLQKHFGTKNDQNISHDHTYKNYSVIT